MMDRKFFLGFIKIHILHHASEEKICGVEMAKELRKHGYSISPGILYPTLHSLEKDGYLKSEREIVAGKVRKYYRITRSGSEVLEKSKGKIKELVEEIMSIPKGESRSIF